MTAPVIGILRVQGAIHGMLLIEKLLNREAPVLSVKSLSSTLYDVEFSAADEQERMVIAGDCMEDQSVRFLLPKAKEAA
jgi:hypothetical protein